MKIKKHKNCAKIGIFHMCKVLCIATPIHPTKSELGMIIPREGISNKQQKKTPTHISMDVYFALRVTHLQKKK